MGMKPQTNGPTEARKILEERGLDDVIDISLDLLIADLGGIFIEEELANCDGRIVFGNTKTLIKINSAIPYEQRKRFATAHEIGHLVMHKNMNLPDDNYSSLNVVAGTEKYLKTGSQELEANEFASELLMPTKLFIAEAQGKRFSPQLLRTLADKFKTSLTATAFKYLQCDLHPICLVMTDNGKVRYWKKSDSLKVWLNEVVKFPPPTDSVAAEYIKADYGFVYAEDDKKQVIDKSTWFRLNSYEEDSRFYEYCIPTKTHKTVLSIIWEN